MGYVDPELLLRLREIDLLTYLQTCEPDQLVRVSGNTWCTKEHDSLKISNGKWHWFSQKIGGKSALDYLIDVKEMRFHTAVETLLGHKLPDKPLNGTAKSQGAKELKLPELVAPPKNAVRYLLERGIDPKIVDACVEEGLLLETKKYHNAVFVGFDQDGTARYAALRGTMGDFKGEASGSDKRFAFLLSDRPDAETVHVFESAIDALSYATLMRRTKGHSWREAPLLSLGGVAVGKKSGMPIALEHFLEEHSGTRTLLLHLDNDEPGRKAAQDIIAAAESRYEVQDRPPTKGKDVNEYLLQTGSRNRKKDKGGDAR